MSVSARMTGYPPLFAGADLDGYIARDVIGNDDTLPYSTDIAAAWRVVDCMMARGLYPEVGHDGDGWYCSFFIDADDDSETIGFASASGEKGGAAFVICLAALEAAQKVPRHA